MPTEIVYLDDGRSSLVDKTSALQKIHAILIQKFVALEDSVHGLWSNELEPKMRANEESDMTTVKIMSILLEKTVALMAANNEKKDVPLWKQESLLSKIKGEILLKERAKELRLKSIDLQLSEEFEGVAEFESDVLANLNVIAQVENWSEWNPNPSDDIIARCKILDALEERLGKLALEIAETISDSRGKIVSWSRILESFISNTMESNGIEEAFKQLPECDGEYQAILTDFIKPWYSSNSQAIRSFLDQSELGDIFPSELTKALPLRLKLLGSCLDWHSDELRCRQRKIFESKVQESLTRLEELWKALGTRLVEREKFLNGPIQAVLYTEVGVQELAKQITWLERELEEKSHIIKVIQERLDLIQVSGVTN